MATNTSDTCKQFKEPQSYDGKSLGMQGRNQCKVCVSECSVKKFKAMYGVTYLPKSFANINHAVVS